MLAALYALGEIVQLSELYRRGVVLPLSSESEEALRCSPNEMTNVEVLEILDNVFYALVPLFSSINKELNLLIDDYETEFVDVATIEKMIVLVHQNKGNISDYKAIEFIDRFVGLMKKAVRINKPLVFVF